MGIQAKWLIVAALATAAIVSTGCGQHVEKKHENLVSPSQEGTQAQREPQGPVHHGEAPSNVDR